MIRHLLFISCFLFLVFVINAQNYYVRNYTVRNGLANNAVRTVFKDADGYLWIGTDAGVSKFNGEEFVNYTADDGLSGNKIWSITQDKKGTLWFGCYDGGITKLKDNKFTTINTGKFIDNHIRKLFFSEKFDCVLAGTDNGLAVFYNDTSIYFSAEEYGNVSYDGKRMQVMDFLETEKFIYVYI